MRDADPTLDDDVAAWFADDCPLPRLTLLGPVRARTRGKALAERKPYMTEVLTYIATRPHGATPDEVADAMGITVARPASTSRIVRDWLGTNPRTGAAHLPDARAVPSRPDPRLGRVPGPRPPHRRRPVPPPARPRPDAAAPTASTTSPPPCAWSKDDPSTSSGTRGWAWLHEGDRLDHHLTAAIVDVAHIVTTHALHAGDLPQARLATETALLAAPEEEIPRLDLARITKAEGLHAAAEHILRNKVSNRSHDDGPPPDLSDRTQEVLESHDWAHNKRSAS